MWTVLHCRKRYDGDTASLCRHSMTKQSASAAPTVPTDRRATRLQRRRLYTSCTRWSRGRSEWIRRHLGLVGTDDQPQVSPRVPLVSSNDLRTPYRFLTAFSHRHFSLGPWMSLGVQTHRDLSNEIRSMWRSIRRDSMLLTDRLWWWSLVTASLAALSAACDRIFSYANRGSPRQ